MTDRVSISEFPAVSGHLSDIWSNIIIKGLPLEESKRLLKDYSYYPSRKYVVSAPISRQKV